MKFPVRTVVELSDWECKKMHLLKLNFFVQIRGCIVFYDSDALFRQKCIDCLDEFGRILYLGTVNQE